MLESGHAQVRDGNEVSRGSESPGSSLGLLQQAVHGLHIGDAATVQHPAHDRVESFAQGLGQFSERLQAAALRPAKPALQFLARMPPVVARRCAGVDRAQCYLQAPRPRTLERAALQPVRRAGLPGAPVPGVAAHAPGQTLE